MIKVRTSDAAASLKFTGERKKPARHLCQAINLWLPGFFPVASKYDSEQDAPIAARDIGAFECPTAIASPGGGRTRVGPLNLGQKRKSQGSIRL